MYIDSGYIDTDYYEGDITTTTPTAKIVSIPYSFVLDGTDITEYVIDADITRENGKAFAVLGMKLSGYVIPSNFIRNKDIRLVVTIGLTVYSFILFDVDVGYKKDYNIVAKTQGCLLDYPFATKQNDTYIGSANTIINELTGSISSYNALPDFDFNDGSFILDGTPLEGIEKLIAVSGGTMFEVNDHLVFVPHLNIETDVPKFIFNDDILTSKTLSDNYSGSTLLNKVVFNADDTDLLSEPLITMVYEDGCTRPYFLLNPIPSNIADVSSNLGTMTFTHLNQIYQDNIEGNTVSVSGGIKSIKVITLDGTPIDSSEYEFIENYNSILFTTAKVGLLSITYVTTGIQIYEINGVFDFTTKSRNYNIQYLTQILDADIDICPEVVSSDGLNDFSIELVGNGIVMDAPTQFDVIGVVNNLAFISDPSAIPTVVNGYYAYGEFDTTFMETISVEVGLIMDKTFSSTMKNVTENVDDGGNELFGFFTTPDIDISETMIGAIIINMIKDDSNPLYNIYYSTNATYAGQNTTSTYSATVDRYTIPIVGVGNNVQDIQFFYDGGVSVFSYPDLNDGTYAGICSLPADLLLDISSLLDLYPQTISGQVVVYDDNNYTINSNGTITIYADKAIRELIDTAHLRKGSYITVDTTNSEVA